MFGAGLPTPPECLTVGLHPARSSPLMFGAGLPTPPESLTVGLHPARSSPVEGHPRSAEALDRMRLAFPEQTPKYGDPRSGTRAGSGDPRTTNAHRQGVLVAFSNSRQNVPHSNASSGFRELTEAFGVQPLAGSTSSLSMAGNVSHARIYVDSNGAGMYRVSDKKIGADGSESPMPIEST